MNYSTYTYLYPPRAGHVITSDLLHMYEERGWVAQYKKNGTSTTITIDPLGNVKFMTRHATAHKAWQCPTWLQVALLQYFPAKRWTMIIAELLHNKTPSIKDTLYIYDVIVYQNTHLIGSTFNGRQKILDGIFPHEGKEADSHWEISAGIWRAKNLTSGFHKAFADIADPKIDEGLVVKDPAAKLKWCNKAENNTSWQVKCRYPTKNSQF